MACHQSELVSIVLPQFDCAMRFLARLWIVTATTAVVQWRLTKNNAKNGTHGIDNVVRGVHIVSSPNKSDAEVFYIYCSLQYLYWSMKTSADKACWTSCQQTFVSKRRCRLLSFPS